MSLAGDVGEIKTRQEFVVDRLRAAILKGELKPGQRLDQNEVASLLKVSRSPVREAIRELAAEGLVTISPHHGATVAELSSSDLDEIYFVRAILEGIAARLAVPRLTLDDLAQMQSLYEQVSATRDPDLWPELNHQFHDTLYQAAGRPRMLDLINNLRNAVAPYIRQFIASDEHLESSRVDHGRILEACRRGDAVAAQIETQNHIKHASLTSMKYWQWMLDTSGEEQRSPTAWPLPDPGSPGSSA